MSESTHRYWTWNETEGRFFLSGSDGAESIAELTALAVSDDELRADLDLIVACVNHFNAKMPGAADRPRHPRREGERDMTETAEQQIDRLAQFIMAEVPGEPSQSQGAVDTAIRIIRRALSGEPPREAPPEGKAEEPQP